MTTEIKFTKDEILFLLGESGMVGIVKAGEDKMLFIGTPDSDEIVHEVESYIKIANEDGESKKSVKVYRIPAHLINAVAWCI